MRRSWLGFQLVLLSCALLLAVVAVEGRHGKEEEGSLEEECRCVEEGCKKRCHHEEEECCCEKRCHHEEEECCCEKKHHHKDEECCKKKHSHGEEEAGKKKPSRVAVEEEAADKKKAPHKEKRRFRMRIPFLEESEDSTGDSSEIYKDFAKEQQEMIMKQAAQTSDAVPRHRKEQAIAHFNQRSEGTYYKRLEDGQLEYKKAIGVMIYVKMLLAETNCTKTEEQKEAGVEYSRAYLEKEGCQLLPQFKQEKHNCTFGIFLDMRTEKKVVTSRDCTIIPGIKQLPKPLKGLSN
ncbi:uncharacterized protein LOC117657673 [Pantherophis guttatus]|uniref:Uncharacterized protein LOC117657673 n=1 Tax=Pantherophis guttatus TaxID=94885 RepID=A0A6P9AST5_PANGU|nr:uncharacterized protein LOC117657673 [Pantherophis guttatus]